MSVIMSINTIILCITFVSFVVFGTIQTASADEFKIDQFLGVWYVVGIISPTSNNITGISCYQLNITREEGRQQNFKKEFEWVFNGTLLTTDGYGKIVNSVVIVLFPYAIEKTIHTVSIYDHGRELIFYDLTSSLSHELLSRRRTVTATTADEFKKLAEENNVEVVYIQQNNCQ